MKTNSKKRLVVSSVSMLLVAMLALGTATYAWFTSSTTALADGINVKTIKSSKLEIAKSDVQWGTRVEYGVANKTLMPVSTASGTAWFTTNATDRTSFAGDGTFTSAADDGSYFWHEQLNVHNAGEATVNNAKIEFTMPTSCKYVRVALVEANDAGTSATLKGDFTKSVYDNDGVAYDAASATDSTTAITPNTTYSVSLGNLKTDDVKYYNLYVWFEGQDVDCKDANAGQAIPNIEFTVTGDTAIES